ncbi:MAG TPA: hypothetical protein VNX88_21995 [Terriglobales bacterium]|nr:hypothetical protein [Terriglobales bacterium]
MSDEDDLKTHVTRISGFADLGHAYKIRLFAWLQHFLRKKPRFTTGDINWCYKTLSYQPSNTSQYFSEMEGRELLKDKDGYFCEGKFRAKYDGLYGEHDITLNIRQMVKDLVKVVPDIGEKDIMKEALICLRHDAGRAAIIMVWNIAFYHLCQYVLKHKLTEFNNRLPIRYPKKWKSADLPVIKKYEDFADEMAEREVIEVCNSAGIINGDLYKVYVEKLNGRNSAAHPSTIHVTQVQAEGYIDGLIRNTVLLLPI